MHPVVDNQCLHQFVSLGVCSFEGQGLLSAFKELIISFSSFQGGWEQWLLVVFVWAAWRRGCLFTVLIDN